MSRYPDRANSVANHDISMVECRRCQGSGMVDLRNSDEIRNYLYEFSHVYSGYCDTRKLMRERDERGGSVECALCGGTGRYEMWK